MRLIVVPVADRPECALALNTAFGLARHLGADVVGCHMRAQRDEAVSLSVDSSWLSGGGSDRDWPLLSEADATSASACARTLFETLAKDHAFPMSRKPGKPDAPVALWRERVGTPSRLMPIFGPASDMLVVSRPLPGGGRKARTLVMQALFTSHRPVLVLPQHDHKLTGKRIAIGWNRGGFEARTLLATLSMLKQAEDVVFLTVGRDNKPGPKAQEMITYLSHHGVKARRKHIGSGRDPGNALVKTAEEEGAELLVCGAYSRGRLHERLFGGMTEHLLMKTNMPVLMMHH